MANINPISFTAPNDYATELKAIERRREYAKMLQQQALQPESGGEMVSGIYVRKSPLEALAKAVRGYSSMKMQRDADKEEKDLAERARTTRAQDWAEAIRLRDGTPEQLVQPDPQEVQQSADQGTPEPFSGVRAAVPGSKRAMYARLVASTDPGLNQLGMAGELKEDELKAGKPNDVLYNGAGQVVSVLPPGPPKFHSLSPGQQLVPEPTMQPGAAGQPGMAGPVSAAYTAPEKPPTDITELKMAMTAAGIDPASPQGQAFFRAFVTKKATHQPAASTNVSVNTDKTYAGHVASGLAAQDVAAIDAGRSAPQRMQAAQSVKQVLTQNPITGTGAEARLMLNKALSTAGIIDGKQVTSTENLAALLASQTLDAIKSSGLGSGQGFTDKDRQFLERARSGNIEVNAQTLNFLADLNERSAVASIQRGNEIIKRLQGSKEMGQVGVGLTPIQQPSSGFKVLGVERP